MEHVILGHAYDEYSVLAKKPSMTSSRGGHLHDPVKVAETSEAPLEDIRCLWLCNKVTKRASSSHTVTNRFNLKHHYQSMVWGDGNRRATYLQTIDWLLGGVALLAHVEEEGDL
jgi:hypothetical protein